ncbi:hypothetical protein [Geopseudomonas aromaticivorans]
MKVKEVEKAIESGVLGQALVSRVARHPVLHFSGHAQAILAEGFRFGEGVVSSLDCTYANGTIRQHAGPGFNFAFNTIGWDIENDCFDYEVCSPQVGRSLMGMYGDQAILCMVDGLYTRHYDEFHQVIFRGADADLSHAILLENTGHFAIDGEPACDENGNPVECWEARTHDGTQLVERSELLGLRECVVMALQHLEQIKVLSAEATGEFREVYAQEIEEMAAGQAAEYGAAC